MIGFNITLDRMNQLMRGCLLKTLGTQSFLLIHSFNFNRYSLSQLNTKTDEIISQVIYIRLN